MKKCGLLLALFICFLCFCSCKVNHTDSLDSTTHTKENSDESIVGQSTESVTPDEEVLSNGDFLNELVALQYGKSESDGLHVNHHVNYSYTESEYQDDVLMKITAVVSDVEYELKYENTVDGPLHRDTVHKYKSSYVTQWFDASTGICVYYSVPSKNVENENDRCTLEKQMEIARAFLNDQVTDPENYQITNQNRTSSGILYVYFTRMVGELSTCDQVIVKVDQSGAISLYRLVNVGEMKDVQPIPESVLRQVDGALDDEANRIYNVLEEQGYTWSYEKRVDRLVRLDNGSLAIECYVDATITKPDGTTVGDGAWFIIPITEPVLRAE